jgi:hypothetical protein
LPPRRIRSPSRSDFGWNLARTIASRRDGRLHIPLRDLLERADCELRGVAPRRSGIFGGVRTEIVAPRIDLASLSCPVGRRRLVLKCQNNFAKKRKSDTSIADKLQFRSNLTPFWVFGECPILRPKRVRFAPTGVRTYGSVVRILSGPRWVQPIHVNLAAVDLRSAPCAGSGDPRTTGGCFAREKADSSVSGLAENFLKGNRR